MPLNNHTNSQTEVKQKVRFPFGPMDVKIVPFAAVMSVDIDNYASVRIATMTANGTLNLANIPSDLAVGTTIGLVIQTAGAQVLTLGTGFQSNPATYTGVAGATFNWSFVWSGTAFVPMSAPVRVI